MATEQAGSVLQELRKVALRRSESALSDGQVLHCYLQNRDEIAFAELVRRHGPTVWGVCHRVLRDRHNAEDAFQATFLVLVRKAAVIQPRELVGNWLYGVAYRTALKAKTMTAKRQLKERKAAERGRGEAVNDPAWSDVQSVLDEELNRLPEKYGAVIVLCELQGKTKKQAARALSVPEGTVSTWLARGRKLLARRLAGRGIALGAGSLAVLFSQCGTSQAAPTVLAAATVRAASQLAAGSAAGPAVSIKALALAEGVLKTMLLTKLKIATAVLLTFGVLAFGAGLLTYAMAVPNEKERSPHPSSAVPGPAPVAARTDQELIQGTWRVVAAKDGGRDIPDDERTTARVVFTDKHFRLVLDKDKEVQATYKLDPSQKPKWITFVDTKTNRTLKGIYELKGDDLKLVVDEGGDRGRPTEFVSESGTVNDLLFILKREPPAKKNEQPKKRKQISRKFTDHSGWLKRLAIAPGSRLLASGAYGVQDELHLRDLSTGELKRRLALPKGELYSLAFSPDGKTLGRGGSRDIFLHDSQTGELRRTLKGHGAGVFALAFSADGSSLVSAGGRGDKTVRVWDVGTGELRHTLLGHNDEVLAVALVQDGKTIASAGGIYDRAVKLWDVRTGKLMHSFDDLVTGLPLVFAPDGSLFAVGYAGGVKLWDVHTGKLQRMLVPPKPSDEKSEPQLLQAVAFSPDGKLLAGARGTLRESGEVILWDLATGEVKQVLRGPDDQVVAVTFSPEGDFLIGGTANGGTRIWTLSEDEPSQGSR